jgi:hypothetical protein
VISEIEIYRKVGSMTQAEIEVVARRVRLRSLHSSWDEWVGFWQGVLGTMASAHRASTQSIAASQHMSSVDADADAMQREVRDQLAHAMRELSGGVIRLNESV